MKDVAARASVSLMTVSNVINARPGTVSAETRRRVERAMDELGYHRNLSARALRSARSSTLAFLLRDESQAFLADPLTNLQLTGVGDVLRERDQALLIQTIRAGENPERLLDPVLRSSVDGSFVLVSGDAELREWYIERLKSLGRPFVVFDEVLDDNQILSVRAADRDAGRLLGEYLLAKGHERIAFMGRNDEWAAIEQCRLGYLDALRGAQIDPAEDPLVFDAALHPEGGAEMVREIMGVDRPPTAIMCCNDVLAIGAIHALREMGIRVPEDVAVTGVGDLSFSGWMQPALTTVRIPAYEMGRASAGMLLAEIEGDAPDVRQIVIPIDVIPRESA